MAQKLLVKDAKIPTLAGGLAVLNAAIEEAERIGQPMCISVVDTGGNLHAFGRMDGSKALSLFRPATTLTAALSNEPTGGVGVDVEIQVTLAHDNDWTNLISGIPIRVDGFVLGAGRRGLWNRNAGPGGGPCRRGYDRGRGNVH